mmetsp:Transcript_37852/g.42889  ORF Transcript_37852/g.42889 Transcript_37852/m.42889 type:complete len:295 (+) Transcript_37852:15-899(+)
MESSGTVSKDKLPVFYDSFVDLLDKDTELLTKSSMEMVIPQEIWTIDKPLSEEECKKIIEHTLRLGFHEATVGTGQGLQVKKEWRNNTRCIINDEASAKVLWDRVKNTVSKCLLGWMPVGLNPQFRFYRYEPGQYFKRHYDGCYTKNQKEISSTTFQIYLTDEATGGETTFFDEIFPDGQWGCIPKKGKGLFFHHRGWFHEGSPVTEGVKISIRSDVIYRMLDQEELHDLEEKGFHDYCFVCNHDVRIGTGRCRHKIMYCNCNFLEKPDPKMRLKSVLRGRFCSECEQVQQLIE